MAQLHSLDDLAQSTKLLIVELCAPSPYAQMNQVACVSRSWNIAWRKDRRTLVFDLVEQVICSLEQCRCNPDEIDQSCGLLVDVKVHLL